MNNDCCNISDIVDYCPLLTLLRNRHNSIGQSVLIKQLNIPLINLYLIKEISEFF